MFSIPRPGCVATGKQGHAYVFDSSSGESYIFLGHLAGGAQSIVQLVANIYTNEVVVRKVSKRRPLLTNGRSITDLPEDREIRILDHLTSLAHNPINAVTGTPRWAPYIGHEDISLMSTWPRPAMVCSRVSYWKLCNGGSLVDWVRDWRMGPSENGPPQPFSLTPDEPCPFPISIAARCIAQVSETLHFMYNAGREAVYHGDLHLGNVFVHFGERSDGLPDFYLGDFGWARTASEALADGLSLYGGGLSNASLSGTNTDQDSPPSPPPGTAPPGQRRRWDMLRFSNSIKVMTQMVIPVTGPRSDEAKGLERLITMLQWLNEQEALLAASNPHSRPHSLVEFIREARKLERSALLVEKNTEEFKNFIALGKKRPSRL